MKTKIMGQNQKKYHRILFLNTIYNLLIFSTFLLQ